MYRCIWCVKRTESIIPVGEFTKAKAVKYSKRMDTFNGSCTEIIE